MDANRAQALANTLHHGQLDAAGTPLIDHVQRVAAAVPREARVVAWLHEVLEHTSISEESLLSKGLSHDELRALRLLTRDKHSRSNTRYLAHVELIARARGAGASVARSVKRADLVDRARNPPIPSNGWSPPYELGLELLQHAAVRWSRPEPFHTPAARPHPASVSDSPSPGDGGASSRPADGWAEPRTSGGAWPPVTRRDDADRSKTEPGLRAQQLGSALRGLAAELVDERRKVAELRRKVAELTLLLEGLQPTQGSEDAEAGGAGSRLGPRNVTLRDAGRSRRATTSTGEAQ